MLSERRHAYILNIVFIGDFNPSIIQPYWLRSKELIKEEEAESASVNVIHNELVQFVISDWAIFQITRNRFELTTTQQAYFEPLKDLATSIFRILKETPLKSVGINHIRHYTVSEKEYRVLGDKLSPVANWQSVMKLPRLSSVEIVEQGESADKIIVRVQPSDTLKAPFSFMIYINQHIDSTGNATTLLKMFEDQWQHSFGISDNIEKNIATLLTSI
jgi:hypothetical protein